MMPVPRSVISKRLLLVVPAAGLIALFIVMLTVLGDRPAQTQTRQTEAARTTTRTTESAGQTPGTQAPEISSTTAETPRPESEPTVDDVPGTTVSGTTAPPGDLDGWQLVFTENFDVPAALGTFDQVYGSRWLTYRGPDTSKRGTYSTGSVLSVADGVLDWHVHTADGQHKVAAIMVNGSGYTYGRFSVRFRADEIPGYKMVVILWPVANDQVAEGEIDFPEAELTKDEPLCAFLHGRGDGVINTFSRCTQPSAAGTGWHTATIVWEPGKITYLLDDQVFGTTTSKIPSTPFHFVFQVESNLEGKPIPDTSSGHIQLDWATIHVRR